jgi:hypothetical protein
LALSSFISQSALPWPSLSEVQDRLREQYDLSELLSGSLDGRGWSPIRVALAGPDDRELAADAGAVRRWSDQWQRLQRRSGAFRLEYAETPRDLRELADLDDDVTAERIPQLVPVAMWVDRHEDLCALLGVTDEYARFESLRRQAAREAPRLEPWMRANPLVVLTHSEDWPAIARAVSWMAEHAGEGRYLRQVDAPGVDAGFIERHRGVVADALDALLPAQRVDRNSARSDLAGRYGFRVRPNYVRFRLLAGQLPIGLTEMVVRADEFANIVPAVVSTVFVVEDEFSYLGMPAVPDAIAIEGGAAALVALTRQTWSRSPRVVYWGDIATSSFAALDRLRLSVPNIDSMLMDRETLLAYRAHWQFEEQPVRAALERLRPDEAALYTDLVDDVFGRAIRLNQDRIDVADVSEAIADLS